MSLSGIHEAEDSWPRLELNDWQDTYATLHRWLQVVGKTRLGLAPSQNHWWHVALYVTARGLGTSAIPYADRNFQIDFDFIDHVLLIETSDGRRTEIALAPRSVADFFAEYKGVLEWLDIHPKIWPVPVELEDATPFALDRAHHSYDPGAAERCWRALMQVDRVLKTFRSGFIGKCSPSHLWWGAFDIACTRFSGRRAPQHPGGIPHTPDFVTREAYSHECISAGWWPGSPGGPVAEAAFYAYAYPEPAGCPTAVIGPGEAGYNLELREWILPYEAVRASRDPDAMVLEFLESTYAAAATLGGWDRSALERNP
jgi:hypothetical protein